MAQRPTETNGVTEFLDLHPGCCKEWTCGTCGGVLFFREELWKAFPKREHLIAALTTLPGEVLVTLRGAPDSVARVLDALADEEREEVVENWATMAGTDPELALWTLRVVGCGAKLPDTVIGRLLATASPLIQASRPLRDKLRRVLPHIAEWPACLRPILRADRREDREKAEDARKAAELRAAYLDGLSGLSFPERVETILKDPSIDRWRGWREEWTYCDISDIADLDLPAIQTMIDALEADGHYRWEDALRKLYDRRHEIRLCAMEATRQRLRELTPEHQLLAVIRDRDIPIEHFPVELAAVVTKDWLDGLLSSDRERFVSLAAASRLKVWRKTCESIGIAKTLQEEAPTDTHLS